MSSRSTESVDLSTSLRWPFHNPIETNIEEQWRYHETLADAIDHSFESSIWLSNGAGSIIVAKLDEFCEACRGCHVLSRFYGGFPGPSAQRLLRNVEPFCAQFSNTSVILKNMFVAASALISWSQPTRPASMYLLMLLFVSWLSCRKSCLAQYPGHSTGSIALIRANVL